MRTTLLASVAAVALIGCTAMAVAQQDEHGGGGKPGAAEQHQGAPGGAGAMSKPGGAIQPGGATQPGGAMQHTQQPGGGSAQNQMPEQKGGEKGEKGLSQGEERGNATNRNAQGGESGKSEMKPQEHAQTPSGGKPNENAQGEERGNAQGTAQTQRGGAAGGKSVQLSASQRTQISGIIVKDRNVARVNSVSFSINVGTVVPRDVHVAVLPVDVVEIVPEYRGFDYVVVGDQLLIIDPVTLEIVAILPA